MSQKPSKQARMRKTVALILVIALMAGVVLSAAGALWGIFASPLPY